MDFSKVTNGILRYIQTWEQKLMELPVATITNKRNKQNRMVLMELIEDRNGKGSIIVTSQVPVNKWYDLIGEKTIADAIMDRLVHQSHRIELAGESMRRKKKVISE